MQSRRIKVVFFQFMKSCTYFFKLTFHSLPQTIFAKTLVKNNWDNQISVDSLLLLCWYTLCVSWVMSTCIVLLVLFLNLLLTVCSRLLPEDFKDKVGTIYSPWALYLSHLSWPWSLRRLMAAVEGWWVRQPPSYPGPPHPVPIYPLYPKSRVHWFFISKNFLTLKQNKAKNTGGFFWIFCMYLINTASSALQDRTQNCCDFSGSSQTLLPLR